MVSLSNHAFDCLMLIGYCLVPDALAYALFLTIASCLVPNA
jgi:hypothetical protein